jgi:hypothetical protein
MRLNISTVLLACFATLFIGCGSDQVKAGGEPLPSWFTSTPEGCAAGVQKFRGNLSLAKSGSIGKGRTELARQLQVQVKAMLKQYAAEGGTDKGDFSEEKTDDVSRQLTDLSLSGTRAVKTHVSQGATQRFYSLVCIEPDKLADAIDKMKQLNSAARKALKSRAKTAFKELDRFTN